MDALSCSVHPIFPLLTLTVLSSFSFPLYLHLILLSKATKAKKKKRTDSILFKSKAGTADSNPTQSRLQPSSTPKSNLSTVYWLGRRGSCDPNYSTRGRRRCRYIVAVNIYLFIYVQLFVFCVL